MWGLNNPLSPIIWTAETCLSAGKMFKDIGPQEISITFKLILVTADCDISIEIALRWTSRGLKDDKSGNKPLPEPILT